MGDKLKVTFDDPEHGWMSLGIRAGDRELAFRASYVLHNSLVALAEAVEAIVIWGDEVSVAFDGEPCVHELRFIPRDTSIDFEIWHHRDCSLYMKRPRGESTRLFTASGSFDEICVPFWRALRHLQTRFSPEEFERRWRRPFPARDMERLTAAISDRAARLGS